VRVSAIEVAPVICCPLRLLRSAIDAFHGPRAAQTSPAQFSAADPEEHPPPRRPAMSSMITPSRLVVMAQ
jgi:hypothetical protein